MSFFAILFALLIEQARPLKDANFLHTQVRNALYWAVRQLDTGQDSHARLAWGVVVLVPAVLSALVHWALLFWLGWIAAGVWNVVILYLTLGFRQFSHHFTEIRDALDDGNEPLARELLAQWQQVDASALPRSEIVRHVIEHSVIDAHRHVFGVFFWYAVLSVVGLGPVGAATPSLSQ
jgi:adenosylcobinamide-phosphate synthase